MNSTWDEYVEALNTLTHAPAAVRARAIGIQDDSTSRKRTADESLRTVIAQREHLEQRIRHIEALLQTTLASRQLVPSGPQLLTPLSAPKSIRDALATIDRVEHLLSDDTRRLDTARRALTPQPIRVATTRRRYRLVIVLSGAVLAIVIFAYFLLI